MAIDQRVGELALPKPELEPVCLELAAVCASKAERLSLDDECLDGFHEVLEWGAWCPFGGIGSSST